MRASLAAAAVCRCSVERPNSRSAGPASTSMNCMRPYGTTESRATSRPWRDEQVVLALAVAPRAHAPREERRDREPREDCDARRDRADGRAHEAAPPSTPATIATTAVPAASSAQRIRSRSGDGRSQRRSLDTSIRANAHPSEQCSRSDRRGRLEDLL